MIFIQRKYDESSIQVLEGLEAVRKRPGMYIGSTDARGLHHLVWEILDNAIDEALSGYGNIITVNLKNDNSIKISDEGRGMPYKMHPTGKPTTEVIFTVLHAGGKFSNSGYAVSGGLHGVGSAVVNALSHFLEVTVYRDGGIFQQRFDKGGSVISKLVNIGTTRKTGTTIWFKPDPKIFSTTIFNPQLIKERMRETAFLLKGLTLVFKDDKTREVTEFCYNDGIKEYVAFINKDKKQVSGIDIINGQYKVPGHSNPIVVDVALQFIETYSELIYSYVNNVRTKDGGTHEMGFKAAITKAVNEYARKYNFLKSKDNNLDGVDIREGLTAIISMRIPEDLLEFEGQTKNKLGSPDARIATEQVVFEKFFTYLEEHREIAQNIISRTISAQRAREAARKAREKARSGKADSKKEVILSGKLTPAQSKEYHLNELFLVEGNSAGGSAKQARDRLHQAILPLRGKVINTEKATADQVLKNEEINTIINTIGAGFGDNFRIDKIQYGKVIIMTDADTDGSHIQILLLTFFFRFMPDLIREGHLYMACPPLYKLTGKRGKKEEIYIWDEEKLKEVGDLEHYTIQRFKGLGEMNSDQLWDTTMNPKKRYLVNVSLDDFTEADTKVSILMGDDVEPRREWIENNVDFEISDDFDLIKDGGN